MQCSCCNANAIVVRCEKAMGQVATATAAAFAFASAAAAQVIRHLGRCLFVCYRRRCLFAFLGLLLAQASCRSLPLIEALTKPPKPKKQENFGRCRRCCCCFYCFYCCSMVRCSHRAIVCVCVSVHLRPQVMVGAINKPALCSWSSQPAS